jgi:hypothetical protein
MLPLADRYADRLKGVLQCFDRVIVWGTLPVVSHPAGLAHFFAERDLPLTEFASFVSRLRDELVAHIRHLAEEAQLEIEYITSSRSFRKEARIEAILRDRGHHPGLVHIFEVTEPCRAFRVRTGGPSGKPYLKPDTAKCKHFYIYFIDPRFGLCHLRIPTWVPFLLQFYCNGHSWLARELQAQELGFTQQDNAFVDCADWERAQQLAANFPTVALHETLDALAQRFCPVFLQLGQPTYHWSITQAEFATDLVFRSPEALRALYDQLSRAAIHTVKAADIATFLGRALPQDPSDDITSQLGVRLDGMRVRHQWGQQASIKMYDKHGCVLRIETTVNDVSFFKHHREVVHRNGTSSLQLAAVRKTIHSLSLLAAILGGCNRRYLQFLATLEDPTAGIEGVERLGQPSREHGRTYRGFNLFTRSDLELFLALGRGEWSLKGFSNTQLRGLLPTRTAGQVSRLLKRLRLQQLIQRMRKSYRYRLTAAGQRVIIAALALRETKVIPALSAADSCAV